MSCEHNVLSCVCENAKGKETAVTNKGGFCNGLKDLLNEHLMPQEFHVQTSRGYGKRKL